MIPEVVLDEYRAGASSSHPELDRLPWIVVRQVIIEPALQALLDDGEAATITLALAEQARIVILDEMSGRRIARQHGLQLVGSLRMRYEALMEKHS